jgi:3-oxoacyl-[acyl-carrier-protein] synthase I
MSEMQQSFPLHIIGSGAATAIGGYVGATIASVQAGITNIVEHPYLTNEQGVPYNTAMASYIDVNLSGTARFNALLNYALSDCINGSQGLPANTPMVLCLPQKRPGFQDEQINTLVQQLENDCPGLKIQPQDVLTLGHTAACQALEQVQRYLTQHKVCLLAGAESYLNADTLSWLSSQNCLYSAENTNGFIPGEAAGCLLFGKQQILEKCQLNSMGSISAFACTSEPSLGDHGLNIGQGLSNAIRQVLHQHPAEQKIQRTVCDLNGQSQRSEEFGYTLTRLNKYFERPDEFILPADCWGDIGAATGLLQMVLAAGHAPRLPPGALTLLWSSGAEKQRAAMLFQSPEKSQ